MMMAVIKIGVFASSGMTNMQVGADAEGQLMEYLKSLGLKDDDVVHFVSGNTSSGVILAKDVMEDGLHKHKSSLNDIPYDYDMEPSGHQELWAKEMATWDGMFVLHRVGRVSHGNMFIMNCAEAAGIDYRLEAVIEERRNTAECRAEFDNSVITKMMPKKLAAILDKSEIAVGY
jgi:hypothetical protein